MRLVVSYTEGDGYTYSCQRDVPVEYESAEKLLCDIEEMVNTYLENRRLANEDWHTMHLGDYPSNDVGREQWAAEHQKYKDKWGDLVDPRNLKIENTYSTLWLTHFLDDGKYYAPNIYTVDEWFAAAERGDLE